MYRDNHHWLNMLFRLPVLVSTMVSLLVAPFVLLVVLHYQTLHAPAVPLVDTTQNIHLGIAGDTFVSEKQLQNVDYIWGANFPHVWQVDSPRIAHIHRSLYQPFDRSGGYLNNVTFPPYYSLVWFQQNHPDWIVYLCDRKTIAYEFGGPNVPLDITNLAVLQFISDKWIYPALYKQYDGIGFDNVNLVNDYNRCGIWKTDDSGNRVWQYLYGSPTTIHGQAYVKSVVVWAKFMYQAIHTFKSNATMGMNFSPFNGGDVFRGTAFNEQLLPYIDVDIDESGLTNAAANPPMSTDIAWQMEADFAQKLVEQGKGQFFIMGYPEKTIGSITQKERQWMLSNYLLLKGNHTYVFLSSKPDQQGSSYGYLNSIPEYRTNIGYALAPFYHTQGVYERDYSQGKIIVNPSSVHAFTIFVTGRYMDLYKKIQQGIIVVAPHSGVVLLSV